MTERLATHFSRVLARFDALRDAGELVPPANDDDLHARVALAGTAAIPADPERPPRP